MDLLSAKKEAIEKSKKEKRTIYIVVDENDGEFTVHGAPLRGTLYAYKNGGETALPPKAAAESSEVKLKSKKQGKSSQPANVSEKINKKEMATKTKKAAKKVAKKSAKKTNSKATGFDKNDKKTWGKKVNVSIKAMRDGLKKGFIYRDPQGVKQTEVYMATRSNQELVREGMYLSGPF
jgi:hypothetical protein